MRPHLSKFISILITLILLSGCDTFVNSHVDHYEIVQNSLPIKHVWEFSADSDLFVPAVVRDGVGVFLHSAATIYALDIESGELKWQRDLETRGDPPFVYENYVYFLDPQGYKIYAIDGSTGQTMWTLNPTQFTAPRTTIPSQIRFYGIDGGKLYLVISLSRGTDILMVNPLTGEVLGKAPQALSELNVSPHAFYIGATWLVVETTQSWLLSKDLSQIIQVTPTTTLSYQEPTFVNNVTYSNGETVKSIALPNYEENWEFADTCFFPFDIISDFPVAYEDNVYLTATCGKIYKLNSQTGEVIWDHQLSKRDYYSFTVFAGVGYLVSFHGKLSAVDLQTGKEVGELTVTPARTAKRAWKYLATSKNLMVLTYGNNQAFAFQTK